MKIGFSVFFKDSYTNKTTGVWGDEIVSKSLCRQLQLSGYDADLYIKEELEKNPVDILIHTTYQVIHPYKVKKVANYNILWIQGITLEKNGAIPLDTIYEMCKPYYDLIITSSRVLAKQKNIPFILPVTGNEDYVKVDSSYDLDVSFIGNIIKPYCTNVQYLQPLNSYKYGLFGGDLGKVSHRTALEIISGSKINLHYGFKECQDWNLVTGRPFFHSMCESFTLMDKVPYFMEIFGNSMSFTEGGEDEVNLIKYYLENEEKRKKMAKESFDIVKSIEKDNLLKIIKGV